ncbi:MAG: 50S ribosomal protein L28 [Candidatus Omnitrophica bacterium]|nr:50S ribosomal protein L28 [Candidatus Omnitrophota bacterium]
MIKRCFICDKGPVKGRTFSRKGLVKAKGGTGSKVTRVNKKTFLPNIQKITVLLNGRRQKINICTKCLKAEKVQKA